MGKLVLFGYDGDGNNQDGTWVTAGEGILNWTARTANSGLWPDSLALI